MANPRATKAVRKRGPLGRLLSGLVALALVCLALLVGAALLIQARIDPDALRHRIEQRCFEATGRTLTLSSAHLALLPVPTLTATGVALAGLPTDPRPQMLTASSLSAHLALWPLIHHVARLDGLTLVDPDLSLDRDANGNANWRFQPPAKTATGPGSTPGGGPRWRIEIGSVRIRDGALAWRDAIAGWSGAATLDRLDATDLAGTDPQADLAGRHNGAAFTATLRTGPLSRLMDASAPQNDANQPGAQRSVASVNSAAGTGSDQAGSPWPIQLVARTSRNSREDAALTVDGTLADPLRVRGFALDLHLDAPRPDGLDALFPHAAIPSTGPVSLSAHLVDDAPADAPRAAPGLRSLSLQADRLDLGALLHRGWSQGLLVNHLAVDAATRTAPVSVSADGVWQGHPLSVHGTAGTLDGWRALEQSHETAAPFDLAIRDGDGTATLSGTADRAHLQAALKATAPSLRALLPVGPALTGMTLSATLALFADRHLAVSDLDLDSHELALSGNATLGGGVHPSIDATLSIAHADIDSLRAGWSDFPHGQTASDVPADNAVQSQAAPAQPPGPASPATPGVNPAIAQGSPPADTPTPPGEHPVPFARLLCCDVSAHLKAASVLFDGAPYKDVVATLSLHDGALSLSPLDATGPAGPIALTLQADATQRTASIQTHPAMLPAATIAALLGRPPVLQGTVETVADLKATGATWEQMARTAEGHAGVSMVDGTISNSVLGQVIGRPQAAAAGVEPGRDGARTAFRCLALPASVAGGVATLDPIALSTNRLVVQGRGTVALSDGRLDLHLLPRLAVGATGASLPVRIGGTLDAPEAALDPAAPGGRFTLSIGGPAPPDPCATDLAAARYGVPGPMPGTAPAEGRHKLPRPIDILRGLGLFH